MWQLFTHPSNIVFSVSISLMLMFAALEGILIFLGGGSQSLLEQFLPEELKQSEIQAESNDSLIGKLFDWLCIGRMPLFIWLIIFLTTYGLSGLLLQGLMEKLTGHLFNAWIVSPAVLFLCMPLVRMAALLCLRFIPQDETEAIYSEELIGRIATIVLGDAKSNSPAQAKVLDQHGNTHYIMVEPELDEILIQGQEVLLTHKTNHGFQAVSFQPDILMQK